VCDVFAISLSLKVNLVNAVVSRIQGLLYGLSVRAYSEHATTCSHEPTIFDCSPGMEDRDAIGDIANSDGFSFRVGTWIALGGENNGDGETWFRFDCD